MNKTTLPMLFVLACGGSEQTFSTISPAMSVAPPEQLLFEDTIKDQSSSAPLYISNAGMANLDVSLTLSDEAGVFSVGEETQWTIAPNDTMTLDVMFEPNNYLDFEGSITLTSNDPENPEVITALVGTGVSAPTPALCLDRAAIDFGEVAQGSTALEFVELENCGGADLEIGLLEQTGSGRFSIETDPTNHIIAPNDRLPMIVGYSPTSESGDNATLTFPTNDPDQPTAQVVLLGNGGGDMAFPVAAVDCPESYNPPGFVPLSGAESYDPEGLEPLTYTWSLAEVPSFSVEAAFTNPSEADTELFIDAAGDYVAQLVVENTAGIRSAPARCAIAGMPEDDIHVELTWDGAAADLDLHLIENDGEMFERPYDCTWCNSAPVWGASGSDDDPRLDLDDRGGFGPENINVFKPADGRYQVIVHYFDDHGDFAVTAKARIWLEGALIWEGAKVLERNDAWQVGTINWPEVTFGPLLAEPEAAPRRSCY